MTQPLEPPTYVMEKTVQCNGTVDASIEHAHPAVYLFIKDHIVECPYCGRIFVYEET
jgi:uncharacterized Zn-finger protein